VPQTAATLLHASLLTGKIPGLNRILEMPATGWGKFAAKSAAAIGAEAGWQTGIMLANEATPIFVEHLASAIDSSIPNHGTLAEDLRGVANWDNTGATVLSLLPYIFAGSGMAVFRAGKRELGVTKALEALGIDRESIEAIHRASDTEDREAIFQQAFSERNDSSPEARAARGELDAAHTAGAAALQTGAVILKMGDGTWTVTARDGRNLAAGIKDPAAAMEIKRQADVAQAAEFGRNAPTLEASSTPKESSTPTTSALTTAEHPVQEIPVDNIAVNKDVKQFKEDADSKTGVVEPLTGKYQPDQDYERLFTRIVMNAPAPIGLGGD
jgi:hypothetical protein